MRQFPDHTILRSTLAGPGPFVLLDSAACSREHHTSYLFAQPRSIIRAGSLSEVGPALLAVDAATRDSWVAGYICYEAAYALEERLGDLVDKKALPDPLLWFGVFDRPRIFNHQTGRWNRRTIGAVASPTPTDTHARTVETAPVAGISFAHYGKCIREVKRFIARGETYQVNFTYDAHLRTALDPLSLYLALRQNQRTPFCSLIRHDSRAIASFSPELFFSRTGRTIRVKPMKGTAARGRYEAEDHAAAAWLAADAKNRSENVMIVDMLRNDLGRICTTGAVTTERLCEVETHPTVLQMTSTIRGSLRPKTSFSEIIRALFPCGSVTGAPKIRTMEIIRDLEKGVRGVYCGAIGFVAPKMRRAVFSVPIRTLVKEGQSTWRYRVGSGIVWDSTAKSEWEECKVKTAFLSRTATDFEIFESMLVRSGRLAYEADHLARLRSSARYFGYPIDGSDLRRVLAEIKETPPQGRCAKVRLFLTRGGELRWDAEEIAAPEANLTSIPKDVTTSHVAILSPSRTDAADPFLFHKTTHRPHYNDAMQRIRSHECYDVIFRNQRGEITEGARSNVFVLRRWDLLTPALTCGLLPGVLRGRLLRAGTCREAVLTAQDLRTADAVYCGNSVRGLVRLRLIQR